MKKSKQVSKKVSKKAGKKESMKDTQEASKRVGGKLSVGASFRFLRDRFKRYVNSSGVNRILTLY